MAARNLSRMNDKSPTASTLPSRTASPVNEDISPQPSSEINQEQEVLELEKSPTHSASSKEVHASRKVENQPEEEIDNIRDPSSIVAEVSKSSRLSIDSHRSNSMRQSSEISVSAYDAPVSLKTNGIYPKIDTGPSESPSETIELIRSDYEAAELRRQEETHSYLERIDALQAKLQYLIKEATEGAKKAKTDVEPGSIDEKLASKDERIALLMEEGHRMSQTELKHMSIIKKLRAKAAEDERRVAEVRKSSEKQEKAAREAQERAKRAEESEKSSSERLKAASRLEKDLEMMRADRDEQDSLIQDLQFRLADATSAARQAEEKAQAEALDQERKRAISLADDLSNLKKKQELAERQYQAEIGELREKSEREKERARVAEIERQGEQNILESRLEAFRARAEEASAGSGGNMQAKLLRQIETLQNQYATASENWQGIEGSLLARAAALQKERDDIAKREVDVRRKARETVSLLSHIPSSWQIV